MSRRLALWVTAIAGVVALVLLPWALGAFEAWHSQPPGPGAMCANNMRGLSLAVVLYVADEDHPRPEPTRCEELIREELISTKMLVCPSSGTLCASGRGPVKIAGHCDYVLISGLGGMGAPADLIRVFELPVNHGQKWVNIAHASGAIQFTRDLNEFIRGIQRTNEFLAEQRGGGAP